MKRILLALDLQDSLKTPEIIVQTVNRLAEKLPTIATTLTKDANDTHGNQDWLNWNAPANDISRANTKYAYTRHNYALPSVVLKTIQKKWH